MEMTKKYINKENTDGVNKRPFQDEPTDSTMNTLWRNYACAVRQGRSSDASIIMDKMFDYAENGINALY